MNPFDFVNSILQSKKDLMEDSENEKEYSPFLTNRALSYHLDCLFYAQEMNIYNQLDSKLQYDYLINTIKPMKRGFSKWVKRKDDDDVKIIQEYFGLSYQKAKTTATVLSSHQISEIKKNLEKGVLK